ncbi:MAG: hypothetical protein R3D33_13655 [Hyphomicrobiaceae bacterium]
MTNWNWDMGSDVDFSKDIDIDVDFDQSFDTDIKVDKDVDINVDIDVKADVEGNTAELTFDVEAVGKDTYAQLDFVVLTVEDELSSINGYAVSAVG